MHRSALRTWRHTARLVVLATPLWAAAPAHAQEAEKPSGPLLKVDLIRMMAAGDYTTDEVLHIVRMNCVTFRPTDRDRADLLGLTGGQPVLRAIGRCRASGQAAGFDRGIPRAVPVDAREAPAVASAAGLETSLTIAPLGHRPVMPKPRFTYIVDDDRSLTAAEVPPRLQNWDQVSSYLLQEYRPAERREGSVVLRVRVDETGRAADSLLAESSGDPYLDAAVLATVPVMRFTPAMSRDRHVAAWTELPIRFETP